MSKHNNSLSPSASKRCNCGRYITIGEEKLYYGVIKYVCPDCVYRQRNPITREQYYKSFNIIKSI